MGSPPEDRDAFRRALAGVKPLSRKKKVELRPPAPAPYPRQTRLDEKAVLAESLGPIAPDDAIDSGNELAFLRNGYPKDVLRKLRRGHWVIEDELDLHGLNRHDALAFTEDFLGNAIKRGLRCLRIVHGKGHGSPNREPVLKALLRRWLPQRAEIVAFAQAPNAQGGGGALLVLLKR
ncbi:MAG TPA: Smr/MutS family protein [Burkholderiales bacterium]